VPGQDDRNRIPVWEYAANRDKTKIEGEGNNGESVGTQGQRENSNAGRNRRE